MTRNLTITVHLCDGTTREVTVTEPTDEELTATYAAMPDSFDPTNPSRENIEWFNRFVAICTNLSEAEADKITKTDLSYLIGSISGALKENLGKRSENEYRVDLDEDEPTSAFGSSLDELELNQDGAVDLEDMR